MSWISKGLEKIGHAIEHNPLTEGSKYVEKKVEHYISEHVPHQHSADRRAANEEVASQIELYKQEKQQLVDEAARVKGERDAEQQRIAKKQIRSARRAYRAPGFMEDASTSYDQTLA